jgi:ribose-phosphate pyrophosphokinase
MFATAAAEHLAEKISVRLGVLRGNCEVEHFPDGELACRIAHPVDGVPVILLHSCRPPANDSVIELLLMADACRRAGASAITAVVPYLAYTRGDKRNGRLECIAARVVADMAAATGISELICIEPHFAQFEGFFAGRARALSAVSLLCDAIRKELTGAAAVVAPDAGALRTARAYGEVLNLPVILMDKTAHHVDRLPYAVLVNHFVIVDDMISTGRSMSSVVDRLRLLKPDAEMFISATHGLFLASAFDALSVPCIRRVFITDTLHQGSQIPSHFTVVEIAGLLAESIGIHPPL